MTNIEVVRDMIHSSITEIINRTCSDDNIENFYQKHHSKVHFIPVRYRVLGGLLQSMNIKYGNFLEKLIHNVIEQDDQLNIERNVSGKRNSLWVTKATDTLIDTYMNERIRTDRPDDIASTFDELLNNIIENEHTSDTKQKINHDVDVLFRNKNKAYVYLELKYNADHDTGKVVNMHRKLLKTYAGLVNHLEIEERDNLNPILYFFNSVDRWDATYMPESNVLQGKQLFDQYFNISFEDVNNCLLDLGNDEDIIALFDKMCDTIRHH